jgi:uncharacterized protein (DUF1501 family)
VLTRRDFLRTSSLLALAPTVPAFLARAVAGGAGPRDGRALVVVQLDGGNDALNTVVPFADPNYARLRPTLAQRRNNLVRLNDALGLHPALGPLDNLLQAGHLGIVPGVGYPNPSRSHFQSMDIWHSARFDPADHVSYGWLGRVLDPSGGSMCLINGSGTPEGMPLALRGRRSRAMGLTSIEEVLLANGAAARRAVGPEPADDLLTYVRRQALDGYAAADQLAALSRDREAGRYPTSGLGRRLELVARLLKANLAARVFYTFQAGYDTHAAQATTHIFLLQEFAGAVAAFFDDLRRARLADRVVLLAFSEFGRTIRENGSRGTDHGSAGCVFLAGPGVRGGVCGTMPSLTDLVQGEPRMTTDFRQVYATVLQDWLGLAAEEAVGGRFTRLPLFRG